jgi:hypothetical protein
MLHDTDPIFISSWTGNALMSVITHFLTSDNYIILIEETNHIIAFTSRPLELYPYCVTPYAPLNKRNNGDVISKGVQTMEAEIFLYKRSGQFCYEFSVPFSPLSQTKLQLHVLPCSVLRPTIAHKASPRHILKLHAVKILSNTQSYCCTM